VSALPRPRHIPVPCMRRYSDSFRNLLTNRLRIGRLDEAARVVPLQKSIAKQATIRLDCRCEGGGRMILIILLLLLAAYVAVGVFASYLLLLTVGISAMSLGGLLFLVAHETKAGLISANSDAEVPESERHQRT